tara:strand:+ start:220 stop:1515 length:1296 start_codon:yes stop_codon:yes gene_type:complete
LSAKNRIAIVFISGSAGELDWILPILDFLQSKNFRIKIIFLTRHALRSVKQNSMCNDFIKQKNSKIELISFGGYFFEKIERIGYLSYRIFLKLKLNKISPINTCYNIYESFYKFIFMRCLPLEILNSNDEKYLFISEFPSLRRPRDNWIKKKFKKSIFFYCPHSPHIYTEELDQKYEDPDQINFNQRFFLLLGHPSDYRFINDGRELAATDLEKIFIGHPKYSDSWLQSLKDKARDFRNTFAERKKINILVLSRGYGSYMNEESQIHLVNSTIRTIENLVPDYNLFVKKHPRETLSHWDNVLEEYPAIEIVNNHILQIATKADLVISFWGSGSMDCFMLGVPVIEYWDPVKHHKQQVPEKDSYTTIYRKLGIVSAANNEKELKKAIYMLQKNNFEINLIEPHFFFGDLIDRSNNWKITLEKIISANGLLNN